MADNNVDISQISIEVEAEAGSALKNIDALSSTLSRLNANSKLTRTINNMGKLATSLSKFSGLNSSVNTVAKMSLALQKLSSVQKLSGLNSALNTLAKFPDVVKGLDATKLSAFSAAIAPLSASINSLGDIQKLSGLNSAVNTLRKIPVVADELSKADFDQFAKDIERVRVAISPLASEMDKVSRGFSALPANIQKAIAANQKLTTSNKNAANSYNVLGIGITKAQLGFGGMLLALRQVTQYLGASLANYNAYVENTNLFTVSMGRFADAGREATQTMQDVLGVDMSEGMRNMGVLQNLTTSFGVLDSQAYVLSKNLTQLGYDMSSFFNIDTASAFEKLQAAISGELEPIRRLGVDISEARLQQELYNLGIDASVQNLTQADKALLRYIAIMKQTGNAQTDMARTLNSPANMIRVFQAQLELLSRSIGSLFIPMLNAVLPPLIAVTIIIREAIEAIATFFGIESMVEGVSDNVADSMGGVSAGIDGVGDSAAAAAKEIAYLIGGFDELNVLPSQSTGSGGLGGAAGGGILGGIELPEYDMFEGLAESKVKEWVEKLRTPLTTLLTLAGAVGLAFGAWKVSKLFLSGLSTAKLITDFLFNGFLIMAGQLENIGKSGQAILKVVEPIAKFFGISSGSVIAIAAAAVIIAIRFAELYATSEKFRQGLENLWEIAKAGFEGFMNGIAPGVEAAIGMFQDLGQEILDMLPDDLREKVVTFFSETFPKLIEDLDLDLWDLILTIGGVAALFIPGGQLVGGAILGFELISLAVRGLGGVSDQELSEMERNFKTAFDVIGQYVGAVLVWLSSYVANTFGGIAKVIDGIVNLDIWRIMQGLAQILAVPFLAVNDLINHIFGVNILEMIRSGINGMIGLFNQFISWINSKLNFSFGGLTVKGKQIIPAMNVNLGNLGYIPYLADGGVLTGPRLVMAGEYPGASSNPEIVTPQNIMRDTVAEANTDMVIAIVSAIQALQQTLENKDMNAYITEDEVGRSAAAYGRKQKRRTGRNPLTV